MLSILWGLCTELLHKLVSRLAGSYRHSEALPADFFNSYKTLIYNEYSIDP
jgi:hypothetical protein